MKHSEIKYLAQGGDTAVLFIHGIVGTPDHFIDFLPLVPKEYSVYNILLPGHGRTARDFGKSGMKLWQSYAESAAGELLAMHKRLIIVAHSMGTLFAIDIALKHSDRDISLFLIASPLKLSIKPAMLSNVAKVYFGKIKDTDKIALAALGAYGVEREWRPWHYFRWIPRYFELFSKISKTAKTVKELKAPTRVYQSRFDEMVSHKAAGYFQNAECATVLTLGSSRHYYYTPENKKFLLEEFERFLP